MKSNENPSCETNKKSAGSTKSPCKVHRRRSIRQRIAPVEYWNGTNVKYDEEGTLMGIEKDIAEPSESYLKYKQVAKKRRSSTSSAVVKLKVGAKKRTKSDGKYSNSNHPDFNRKRKKSSDINFNDSIISEHQIMDDYPPTKRQKLLSELEPLGEFLASFCMEDDIFDNILSDSIEY